MADPFAILHQINNYIWNADRLRWEIGVTALTVATEGGEASVVNGFDGASIAVADFLPATKSVREAGWTIADQPRDILDRRVEITGPTDTEDGCGVLQASRHHVRSCR